MGIGEIENLTTVRVKFVIYSCGVLCVLVSATAEDDSLKIVIDNGTMSLIQKPVGKVGVLKMLDISTILVKNIAGSGEGYQGVAVPERRHTVYCDN